MTTEDARSFTIVSFDRDKDAATREAAEDRSLNLLLRRSRARSEIYRLPLAPDDAQVGYLHEILAAGPRREMVFLLRDEAALDAQMRAVERLRAAGTAARIFFLGERAQGSPHPEIEARVGVESTELMRALARELLDR